MDLSLTAQRFRSASRRRLAAAFLWLLVVLAGLSPKLPRSELCLSWGLLLALFFVRCVEWRTRRNARFTREWVHRAWQEAFELRQTRLAAQARRALVWASSFVASPAWVDEVNRSGLPPRLREDGEVELLDAQLARLQSREAGILDLRRVTLEFRTEAWLVGGLGFVCGLAGLAGWARAGGALLGCVLLMAASYHSHTQKAIALGSP